MSEIFEYDVDGDGDLDLVEVTEYSDGSTSVVADLDGDGYGDVAAYDEDGDGEADAFVSPEDIGGYAGETGSAEEQTQEPTQETTSEPSETGTGQTYSQWAAEQDYQQAYRDTVYGDKNEW
ncbi:hypothetical protein KZZ52_25155 [Dactylosporangium sp. AC04546]|uniref:hypothetical protein n=1 Tax=Dactylosporangium sp. AC04546 TaxID=2862460 RepID=UPI001EDE0B46|nr:hypothetical protein [Dactylosporangium sp. AC04546]WVK88560.1 hypothetical protein KZZ52_25155 [Dactylosporangium sp. AC04546]